MIQIPSCRCDKPEVLCYSVFIVHHTKELTLCLALNGALSLDLIEEAVGANQVSLDLGWGSRSDFGFGSDNAGSTVRCILYAPL